VDLAVLSRVCVCDGRRLLGYVGMFIPITVRRCSAGSQALAWLALRCGSSSVVSGRHGPRPINWNTI